MQNINRKTKRQARSLFSAETLMISLLCGSAFVFGAFTATDAFAQSSPKAKSPSVEQASIPSKSQEGLPVVDPQGVENPDPLQQTPQDYAVRAVELTHASFFAILILNISALLGYLIYRFWPRSFSLVSKSIAIEDKIRLEHDTSLYLVRINTQSLAIVLNGRNTAIAHLDHFKSQKTKDTDVDTHDNYQLGHHSNSDDSALTVPLTDDDEVNAAVRSMINGTKR